jgi:hypothetical protein
MYILSLDAAQTRNNKQAEDLLPQDKPSPPYSPAEV